MTERTSSQGIVVMPGVRLGEEMTNEVWSSLTNAFKCCKREADVYLGVFKLKQVCSRLKWVKNTDLQQTTKKV